MIESRDGASHYDRDLLLSPTKRNQIIELWEVEKFGRDSFGDPNAVSLYGMTPAEWHARGVRILARTTLEAVRDPLGERIGRNIARVAATAPRGSAIGVNIAALAAPIRLVHGDFRTRLGQHRFPDSYCIVAFLAPPWADALSKETRLDLGRTKPPIRDIIDAFERVYPRSPLLYAVEVHERLVPVPLAELRTAFEWSELNIYDVTGPTGRHGLLLGTRRWR
jgi:hypothetical protein